MRPASLKVSLKLRRVLVGVAIASSATVAQAGEKAMLDACIQHYVASELAAYDGKITIDTAGASRAPQAAAGQRHYQVAVAATDRATGKPLASAICTVDRAGNVVSIKVATGMSEKLAARLKPTSVARVEGKTDR